MVYPSALYVAVQDGVYDITNLNSNLYLTNTHSVSTGTVNVYQTAGIQLFEPERPRMDKAIMACALHIGREIQHQAD